MEQIHVGWAKIWVKSKWGVWNGSISVEAYFKNILIKNDVYEMFIKHKNESLYFENKKS